MIVHVTELTERAPHRFLRVAAGLDNDGWLTVGPLTEGELRSLGADCLEHADELELARRKAKTDAQPT